MKKATILILLSYLTIYIVWGSTYFFIKVAVETIPPFYVVGYRWLFGGIGLLIFTLLSGRIKTMPTMKEMLSSLVLGAFLLIGGNGLVTVAEKKVDSYLVALVLASTPFIIAFFDRVLLKKKISKVKILGIAMGLGGVAALMYNGHSLSGSLSPEMLLVLGGMLLWGFATSLGHTVKTHPDSLVNSGLQMLFIGIISLAGAFFFSPVSVPVAAYSSESWFGLVYLTILGSLAFCAYNYLIAHEPAIRISSYAFVNPVIAVGLGFIFGNESPVPFLHIGLPLIMLGLVLMLYGEMLVGYFWNKKNKAIC